MIKNKYFLIPLFLLVFTLGIFNICFALEVDLTDFGLPESPSLEDYAFFIIKFAIEVAGAIAVLAFIIGAFGYMTSAGNPNAAAEGTSRMKSAILGLILLLSSYLILININLQLVKLEIKPLPKIPGLFLKGRNPSTGELERKPAPTSSANIREQIPLHLATILYECETTVDGETLRLPETPDYLVFFYPETNFGGNRDDVIVRELKCDSPNNFVSLGLGNSFEIRHKTPGVYLYESPSCAVGSYRSPVYTSSQADLGEFKKKVLCVEIVNNPDKNIFYGAILHGETNFEGRSLPDIIFSKTGQRVVRNVPIVMEISSITIFQWNPDWQTAGDGVTFYSHPFSEYRGGGYYKVEKEEMNVDTASGYYWENPIVFTFNYTGTGIPQEEQENCKDFQKCPGSLKIHGDYLVILFTQTTASIYYCETFYKNDNENENLKLTWITKKKYGDLYKVIIIPIK